MNTILRTALVGTVTASLVPAAAAQTFDVAGTRAAGLGGAYVAVVDDASAAYWNPAGFAGGAYLSLVFDAGASKVRPSEGSAAGDQSSWLLALGAPMLGLSYYRLRSTTVADAPIAAELGSRNPSVAGSVVRLNTLVTHHTGVTLVQSLTDGIAVGATLKLVRGFAASEKRTGAGANHDALLDEANALGSDGTNKFDADLGVMASLGWIKAGLTVRNATEPEFDAAGDGGPRRLDRQARAGVAVKPTPGWLVAADVDLLRTAGPLGDLRDLSLGAEGRVAKRGFVRGGLRFNTAGAAGARAATVSVGSSYAVTASLLVDGQLTAGSDRGARGWGISGRFVY